MTKELNQKLINTWEWLNSYCLSKRDDQHLACGQHAICIVQIDDFSTKRAVWGAEKTKEILKKLEDLMSMYALEDTLIARYNDATFVVVLHYIEDHAEIQDTCDEIKAAITDAHLGDENAPLTVSIGASECRHDPQVGYECAMSLAMDALSAAQKSGNQVQVSNATL